MILGLLALLSVAGAATIDGRVANRGDNVPVPEATVETADGRAVEVDEQGHFRFDAPDDVPVTLVISSPEHRTETVVFTPPLDKPLRVYLLPLGEVGEVIVEAFKPESDSSRHTVDAEQAYETPGTYDDAVRLVQALPGVNVQREYGPTSGDISVRGSLPGESRYFYDGVEVPYLYHFNQYASVFPASQLAKIDLYPSTFSPRYGDATGAVIEATSKEAAPTRVTGNASINLITAGADLRAPLPKGWWISVAGRRSFQDIVGQKNLQYPLWPRFYDFSARAEHVGASSRTAIFTAGSGDRYERAVGELDVLDPVDQRGAPRLDYRRDWQLLGVKHTWGVGRLVSAVVHDQTRAELNVPGHQNVSSLALPTRIDVAIPVRRGLTLETGAELRPDLTWLDVEGAGVFGPLVTREAPAMSWGDLKSDAIARLRVGGYATVNADLGPLRLMPGVRLGFDTMGWAAPDDPSRGFTAEPRVSGRLRLAENTELRFATGRYQQRPKTIQLAWDRDYPTTDSWQASLGLDQAIAGRLEISVEGYYKAQRDVLFQPINGPATVYPSGSAYGGELTMRYRLRETFFLWTWIAASRSFVRADGVDTRTSADQPIAGGLVVSWNILPQLNAAVRYRAASGLPFTGIDGSVFDATTDAWLPRFQSPNDSRMPFYQKIDVHFAYTFRFNKWSLQAALDLWIVPKSSAQLYPTWSYDYSEQGYVVGPTVVPLVGLRASF